MNANNVQKVLDQFKARIGSGMVLKLFFIVDSWLILKMTLVSLISAGNA